jgi:hypothetical protein
MSVSFSVGFAGVSMKTNRAGLALTASRNGSDAERCEHLVEEPYGSAIHSLRDNNMIARSQECETKHCSGGKTARIAGTVFSVFESS